jgi:hypothetical protein
MFLRLLSGVTVFAAIVLGSSTAKAVGDDYCLSTNAYCQQAPKNAPAAEEMDSSASTMTGLGSILGFSSNPGAISTQRSFGVGAIYYKIRPSYVLVTGTGQIGAAISPSNGDDTFFGNPSFETEADYLYRQTESLPFEQLKIVLGAAYSLIDNERTGFSRFRITLGALGKYVVDTDAIKPGGGLTIALGPLVIGGSYLQDETKISADGATPPSVLHSETLSYTGNLALGPLTLDYTHLLLKPETGNQVNVDLANASLVVKRFVISAAYRIEKSDRKIFDSETLTLKPKFQKEEVFGGIQIPILPFAQAGLFYNYYLLDEFSAGLTLFF